MASTFTVSRAQVVYSLCLPLAVLVGYFLADPTQSGSMAVVVLVVAALAFPLVMKWYHPLLIFSCNAAFVFSFLPGGPPIWTVAAMLGLFFVVLNRCVDSRRRLLVGGPVAWSLLALGAVVVLTAISTGGIGLRVLGSATFGGKKYLYVAAGIAIYFVLANQQIPLTRAKAFSALYFLSGLTALLSVGLALAGTRFSQLYYIIPVDMGVAERINRSGMMDLSAVRLNGLVGVSSAICLFMLSRFGMSGLLDVGKPWRAILTGSVLALGMLSGFRSFFAFILLVFGIAFLLEGLHRTRYLLRVMAAGMACCIGLVLFSNRLPFTVQRSLSFLPVEISPVAKDDARGSSEWRFGMWKELLPDVPRYLLKGKGYRIDVTDMMFARLNTFHDMGSSNDGLAVAGDYHNGPLSVVIPFGLWGALAFGWFLVAAGRALYLNFIQGDATLKLINMTLLACFLARAIFFAFLVGGLEGDLAYFAGLVGLSISLNGVPRPRLAYQEVEAVPRFGARNAMRT
jgi:hypothetical protein